MAHLARLHGAQRDVGEELGGGGGDQVEAGLVEVSRLLADQVRVEVLEELVEAELAEALRRVPDSRGRPAWDRCRGGAGAGVVQVQGWCRCRVQCEKVQGWCRDGAE